MGTTNAYKWPLPEEADAPDVPAGLSALATAMDSSLTAAQKATGTDLTTYIAEGISALSASHVPTFSRSGPLGVLTGIVVRTAGGNFPTGSTGVLVLPAGMRPPANTYFEGCGSTAAVFGRLLIDASNGIVNIQFSAANSTSMSLYCTYPIV